MKKSNPFLFLSLTLFIGFSGLVPSAKAQTEGMWRGVSDEGGEVSFEVVNGEVVSFSIYADLTGGSGGSGWLWLTVGSPMVVSGDNFDFNGSDLEVTGSFTSATTSSGTYDYHEPYHGYSSGTWTASYYTDPYITLSPPAWNFDKHTVGTTSDPVSFLLTNTGGGSAAGSVDITGTNADEFQIVGGPGTFSLAPNDTLEIAVYFAPTTADWKTATLTVTGDPPCNDASASLMGMGQDPISLSVSPAYRSVPASAGSTSFTVTNKGDGTMSWYAETDPEDAWLTIIDGASGTNTGTITVNYEPNDGDARTGTVTVISDGAVNSPQTVDVVQDASKVLAEDGAADDSFGYSVSMSGDCIIVGAHKDDDNGSDSGSAYIFEHTDNRWIQRAKLTASDGAAVDYFGESVCMFGDYAIVSARLNDDNGYSTGSAYIFEKPIGGWADMTETAKLTASDGTPYDFFGNAVGMGSDYAVVGAHYDDDNGTNSGSAYVFVRPAGGWTDMTETAKLTASDGASNGSFGHSVGVFEDCIVVGTRYDDVAYIFERPTGGWTDGTETATLTASDGVTNGHSTRSVGIFGDHVLLGGYNALYVFQKPLDGWADMTETTRLTASDGGDTESFGDSVSMFGDYIIVGAHLDDDKGYDSGSAYLFERTESGWAQLEKLTPRDGSLSDNFGHSVLVSADYIVVGAPGDDDNGSDSGAVYVYPAYTNGTDIPTADEFAAVFGSIMDSPDAIAGNFDGDRDVDGSDLAAFAVLLGTP